MNTKKNQVNFSGKLWYGYSYTFNAMGRFVKQGEFWWFFPEDGSFVCERVSHLTEWANNNPLFN